MGYDRVVSYLTGYSRDACRDALEKLHEGGYIRKDDQHKTYTFWPEGRGGYEIERKLNQRVSSMKLDAQAIYTITKEWQGSRLAPISVSVDWGHQEDWACEQAIFTREQLTPEAIKAMLPEFRCTPNGLHEASRGRVIWLLADRDEDTEYYRTHAADILTQAMGSSPPPVVLAVPIEPCPNLRHQILRSMAMAAMQGTPDFQDVSREAIRDAVSRIDTAIDQEWKKLQDGAKFIVPQPFCSHVTAVGQQLSLAATVKRCYDLAYTYSPPQFYDQYKLAATRLRSAVGLVAEALANNTIATRSFSPVEAPAGDIVGKFLRVGSPGSWGMLGIDGKVCEPISTRVAQAWKLLDDEFPVGAGEKSVRDVLLKLMNAPYGYDYNCLTLLFCAWYNFHRHDILMSARGTRCTLESLLKRAGTKPKDFVDLVCFVTSVLVVRRDQGEEVAQVRELCSRAMSGEQFTRVQANDAQTRLETFALDERQSEEDVAQARQVAKKLADQLEQAQTYESSIAGIQERTKVARDVKALLAVFEDITRIGMPPSCIHVTATSPTSLKRQVVERLETIVEDQCIKLEKLSDLSLYGRNLEQLRSIYGSLNGKSGIPPALAARVKKATGILEAKKVRLNDGMRDAPIIGALNAMVLDVGLAQLNEYQIHLAGYVPFSDETKALILAKQNKVDQAISDSMGFVSRISGDIDIVTRLDELQSLQQRINKRYERYAGTPQKSRVDAALERCEKLGQYLTGIAECQKEQLPTPQAVIELLSRLDALAEEAKGVISEDQKALLDKAREALVTMADAKRSEASEWLSTLEAHALEAITDASELNAALRTLDTPHPFLSDEQIARVDVMKGEVEQRINEDQVLAIIAAFERITDPAKRFECITKLRELAERLA